jgi:hypothetical protein
MRSAGFANLSLAPSPATAGLALPSYTITGDTTVANVTALRSTCYSRPYLEHSSKYEIAERMHCVVENVQR